MNPQPQLSDCSISLAERIIYVTLFPSVALIGIFANSLVIFVILFSKKMRCMSAVILPLNLAIADILFIVVVSLPKAMNWRNWREWAGFTIWDDNCLFRSQVVLCAFLLFLVSTSYYVSTLTFYAICAQRYISIMYPFQARTICSARRLLTLVALLWIILGLCEAVHVLRNFYFLIKHRSEIINCALLIVVRLKDGLWTIVFRFTFDVIWCTFLVTTLYFYARMVRILERKGFASRGHSNKKNALKRLTLCMLVFLVCQLPDYVTELIESIFGISTPKSIRHAILFMQLVNNILNPFLYSILSRNFKVELGDLVRGMSGRLT